MTSYDFWSSSHYGDLLSLLVIGFDLPSLNMVVLFYSKECDMNMVVVAKQQWFCSLFSWHE